ncbi:hypothetical protein AZE42_13550 [Rhizopogon vesiculosus]|uniref:Uncharacterized protein n=1 Tax=Rhizopogon vesiculosus TaxID=180088 RepID=A0A1J8QDW6_9AGAM|nr:hypothetical protein AZE42_13550 [Rhizopogon vesiculosus]
MVPLRLIFLYTSISLRGRRYYMGQSFYFSQPIWDILV